MMEEMFLWSARCSANTTNATGIYATAMVPMYAPMLLPSAGVRLPLKICRKVKLGYHSMELKGEKSMIFSASTSNARPNTVKIAASR